VLVCVVVVWFVQMMCATKAQESMQDMMEQQTQRAAGAHLMAYLQARWQISVMSAPEKPLVCFTSRSSCGVHT